MPAPALPSELAEQLSAVPVSRDRFLQYAPCLVRLKSGDVLPRVYVLEESSYFRMWGDEPSRSTIDPNELASIEDSPARLPAALADEVYAAGESGMGYSIFTVEFTDGRSIAFLTGNAVDFPDWPPDFDPSNAVAVKPHVGREHFQSQDGGDGRRSATAGLCLYRAS
jgi:hypothetical protein